MNKTMTEKEIRKKFDDIQNQLDALQNENATFLFLANEGNHFVISGDKYMIAAQISFAMMRYPVVHDIIKICAEKYDELNDAFGENAKSMIMQHQIEKNSGR